MLLLNKKFNRDKLKQTLIDKGINLNLISKAIGISAFLVRKQ